MVHMAGWSPSYLEGIDLGDSVRAGVHNMSMLKGFTRWKITRADLATFESGGFDFVYCIGVLHHLEHPEKGFAAVLRNVKKGGKFHCWVYALEGNAVIRAIVEPLRKISSSLPWWLNKYAIALPLSVPFYLVSRTVALLKDNSLIKRMPLYSYLKWISDRDFRFHHHVAFDQLVSPRTIYIGRNTIDAWLGDPDIQDKYVIFRNGNSWKFGGRKKQ